MPEIKLLVEGGKASAGPPLGPALGPFGINVGQVVAKINEQTKEYAGMTVPVTVVVDPKTKSFEIKVGSPPVSALIKKELGLEKGAKTAGSEIVGNLSMDQVVKIAKLKRSGSLAKTLKAAVKEVLGTCVSMGITVEGKDPREVQRELDQGKYEEVVRE
jgi:large subunit ribosomal protein L11